MAGQPQHTSVVTSNSPSSLPWRRTGRHSLIELVLTAALIFGITSIVRWVIGASPISRSVPSIHLELLLVGVGVGLLLAGLIRSPLGRASGGHMNPAMSVAMWRFGTFPLSGVVAYTVAQLGGSVIGVLAARATWSSAFVSPPVSDGVLQPARSWSAGELFGVEAANMALMALAIGMCLAVPKLAPFVPWVAGIILGGSIALLGTASGASVNPARQLGPALVSGDVRYLGVYLLAPIFGAFAAGILRAALATSHPVLTHRLCGTVAGEPSH